MKETYYFSHDFYARNDPKLQRVLKKHGVAGIGVYWCVVEMLYEQGGVLNMEDVEYIAFALHCEEELVRSVVQDFELFAFDSQDVASAMRFVSQSAIRRNAQRAELAEKRSAAGRKGNAIRWSKGSAEAVQDTLKDDSIANASQSDRKNIANPRKERKGKERKINIDKEILKKNVLSFVDREDFKPIVAQWLSYKKERGESYKTDRSLGIMYRKLLRISGGDAAEALEIIEDSIANNYSGFFEKNTRKNNGTATQRHNNGGADEDREREYTTSAAFGNKH